MICIDNLPKLPLSTHCSCIYFLIRDDCVVYIGQSVNYLSRIGHHKSEGVKDFDSFKVFEIPFGLDVNFIEFCEIADRKPIYNYTLPYLDFLLTTSDITKFDEYCQIAFDL